MKPPGLFSGCSGAGVPSIAILLEPPRPTDDDIRQRLVEVLARPEFSPRQTTDFWRRLIERIDEFLSGLSGLHAAAPVIYWLVIAGCLTLLALLVAHIVWTIRRVFFLGPGAWAAESAGEKRGRLSNAYKEEALLQAAAEEYTEAIRFLFLSLVYRFDESGRVLFPHSYTNREYLSLFDGRAETRSRLQVFVDALDDFWYGERPISRQQYERCQALFDAMR
jgi:hypothetical protein